MTGISSLFSPKLPQAADLPKPQPVATMASESSPSVSGARRRKKSELLSAKGRQSTILSKRQPSTILSGTEAPTYINDFLGQ